MTHKINIKGGEHKNFESGFDNNNIFFNLSCFIIICKIKYCIMVTYFLIYFNGTFKL